MEEKKQKLKVTKMWISCKLLRRIDGLSLFSPLYTYNNLIKPQNAVFKKKPGNETTSRLYTCSDDQYKISVESIVKNGTDIRIIVRIEVSDVERYDPRYAVFYCYETIIFMLGYSGAHLPPGKLLFHGNLQTLDLEDPTKNTIGRKTLDVNTKWIRKYRNIIKNTCTEHPVYFSSFTCNFYLKLYYKCECAF